MTRIDPFSLSTVPVEQYANNKKLRSATAFVWMLGDKYYLITNWHVVTGRNAQTHCLELPVRPEFLRGYFNVGGRVFWKEPIDIPLYNDRNPVWFIHPDYNKKHIDLAAIPLNSFQKRDLMTLFQ